MSNKVSLSIKGDKELEQLLAQLPILVVSSGGPTDKSMRKAGAIVRTRAKQLAPRSNKNPNGNSRDKQSAKARRTWSRKLSETIRSKVVKYPTTSVAIVGPKSPEGNMANFMQEKPRRLVLWGKATMTKPYRIARNWITQAFDETKSQQDTAIRQVLRQEIDKHMKD